MDRFRERWRILGLLAVAELLGMSLWFTASAATPHLRRAFDLSEAEGGWLAMAVQLGFVAGTALTALLNLADLVPSRALFAGSAVAGAAVNASLLLAPSFAAALGCRFLTGMFLAGVYPPAMKMLASWWFGRSETDPVGPRETDPPPRLRRW